MEPALAVGVEERRLRTGDEVDLHVLVPQAKLLDERKRSRVGADITIDKLVGAVSGGRQGVARAVGDDEGGRAAIAAPVRGVDSVDQAATHHRHVRFAKIVDLDPDRNAADLLGAGADRFDAELLGILASDQQDDLAGPLVVAGAASAWQLGAEIDQVPAQRGNGLGVGGEGTGAEDDRYLAAAGMQGSIGHWTSPRQQDHDPIFGCVLDRDPGEPVAELRRHPVRSPRRWIPVFEGAGRLR